MSNPIDAFLFYTKLLTGLVILLNISTLLSVYLITRWLRYPEKALDVEMGSGGRMGGNLGEPAYRTPAKVILLTLLTGVIAVNCLAVFANANLLKATDTLVALFSS